jgi:two-component system, LytTR family, response regulator
MSAPTPVRALIVDDEALACRRLRRLLRNDQDVEIVGTCVNGEEAIHAIKQLKPDLVFLDVQMPGIDGFGVLRALHSTSVPQIIFVTAYDQYAIQAFDVHALDYLLKPFDRERFEEALLRAKIQIQQEKRSGWDPGIVTLLQELQTRPARLERIMIKINGRVFLLKTEEIDWVEAQGKYVVIHAGKAAHLIREGMNALESKLDQTKFVRIHKSSLVNIDRIQQLQSWFHGDYRVILKDGTQLTLSRRYRQNLNELLGRQL